ncbi:MAG TPA: alpha-1,4-glucan--maltose-1-phosphate maltosyltransferase [Thermohalobaculum sp.]|nr:alpha-1,4-glucan--maltose-1-phosphate maltosyltransferase [Thermohalobaculum sp.]
MRLAAERVAIEGITPEIDGGRFPAKAVVGRPFVVEADIFCDGHDQIDAALLTRPEGGAWAETRMLQLGNDRWRGVAALDGIGPHEFTIHAWRDLFATWQDEVAKKHAAGQPLGLELTEGTAIVERTLAEAEGLTRQDRAALKKLLKAIGDAGSEGEVFGLMMTGETTQLMRRAGLRTNLTRLAKPLPVWVDRERALVSAWYELMPRSMSFDETRHGTFDDVIARLPYVKDLGFDVLYFPPIHPIGRRNRKGRNNSLVAGPDDPGSPYAIGSDQGGHDAIHPELGDFNDFQRLVKAAHEHGMEIALDFAIQCAPDHPWIREHPEWFDWRPDGTIKYAENPPKKYEDIVNVHFYRGAIPGLWLALRDVVLFWIGHGVRIFRVDNPHTKPLPFWEWMIGEVRAKHPEAIFLAEAFTRPKMMQRLAKVGFTQSYSYFTWRNTKPELTEYLTELTSGDLPYVMRPNFFANTPDINPVYLQTGGRAAHRVRLILAGSLSPSYGIYNGFEICEATPVPGKEEYLDSEKYQIRAWDFDRPGHIKDDIRFLNRIRAGHPALRQLEGLRFYNAWNDHVLYYAKFTPDLADFVLFAVNLDPQHAQGARIEVPLWEFGLPDHAAIEGRDLVTGQDFVWEGKMQHVALSPEERPYAVWALKNPAFGAG